MTAGDEAAAGRIRSIEVEAEVPGTPEQVWEAIATGPGITAWFVPAEVEEREGGAVRTSFGKLGDDDAVVTAWEPPRRFAATSTQGVAHEVLVEARAAGTCLVRLINSGFTADWEDQLDGIAEGWRKYLCQLRLYLTHFAGQAPATVFAMGSAPGPPDAALAALTGALGIADRPAPGEPIALAAPGVPPLRGATELADDEMVMFRLDAPAPGYGFVAAFGQGEPAVTLVRAYLFGDEAGAVAARDAPAWQAWMDERFPFAQPAPAEAR